MKTFSIEEIRNSRCPNLWHDLLAAGQYHNGLIQVDDVRADAILAQCPGIKGLGDVVALIAQPMAKAVDLVLGTNLRNCGGCSKRKEALNQAMPLNRPQSDH